MKFVELFLQQIMNDFAHIKKVLFEKCVLFVEEKEATITNMLDSAKNDLLSETKSSAGDKHETGRAMLQLEMEKASQQLASVNKMKETLSKIAVKNSSKIACLGSLIITEKANYFLAISSGKITIENSDYYAVSTNSPIGSQLLGKKIGDSIIFNETTIIEIY